MLYEQRQLINVVLEDLEYLCTEWDETIDDASLRRASPVLRRLLGDNHYGSAWRYVGFPREPRVKVFDLHSRVKGMPPDYILFVGHGGAIFHGVQVRQTGIYNYAMTPDEIKARFEAGLPKENASSLTEFMQATCMLVRGSVSTSFQDEHASVQVTRRQVVKYVANKLGGAHFDMKRNPTSKDEQVFAALDRLFDNKVMVADKQAVYYELLSIGQTIAHSEDARRFIEKARDTLLESGT